MSSCNPVKNDFCPKPVSRMNLFKSISFRSVFALVFFLMIFALAVRQSAFIDPDLWWHLQTGQDIVTSRTIPQTDIYSFTKAGSEWITHEWLSEVAIYVTFRVAGWAGLLILFPALIAFAFYLAYRRWVFPAHASTDEPLPDEASAHARIVA